MTFNPRSNAATVAMIAVVKAKQAEAIICEQAQTTPKLRQFVNVDQKRKNAISQLDFADFCPLVSDAGPKD
jgi:hypothetical protein